MRIDLPEPVQFKETLKSVTGREPNTLIKGIATDSRECRGDDLYIAIAGEQVDGHEFISQAFNNGACTALVSKRKIGNTEKEIAVEDPVETLGKLAREWRRRFEIPVLGITGSNGKTSTKDLVRHILSAKMSVHATEGNYNTSIGLPLTLLTLTDEAEISILEMGANQPGDIQELCDIARPTHGIITNVAPAHLEGFGSIEAVAQTKSALFESLSNGTAFVNMADTWVAEMTVTGKSISFGLTPDCDFPADIHDEEDGTISLTIDSEEISTGSQNLSFAKNAIAAAAFTINLWIDWDIFRKQISTFQPPQGRCQVRRHEDIIIIDDTYNANLESTVAAIDYLTAFSGNGRRMLVFGDMFELGEKSAELHQKVGEKCIDSKLDGVFTVGVETLATEQEVGSLPLHQHFDSKEQLSTALRDIIQSGDHILVKGSRGMAMETIIEELVHT